MKRGSKIIAVCIFIAMGVLGMYQMSVGGGNSGLVEITTISKSFTHTTPNITIYDTLGGKDFIYEANFRYITDDISGVVYLLYESEYGATITPMYNKDGTLITKKQLELE